MVNSRAKGIKAELDAAKYFAAQGRPWEDARRKIETGWNNGHASSPDRGDLTGLPGLCVQVKNHAAPLVDTMLSRVLSETVAQAAVCGAMPLLLEKRAGAADVARWWAHLGSPEYVRIVTGAWRFVPSLHHVRVPLGCIVDDLRRYSLETIN